MIYTSYFARTKRVPGNFKCISIAVSQPSFMFTKLPTYDKLKPPTDLLSAYKNGRCTWEQYVDRYHDEVLAPLDPHEVADELQAIAVDRNFPCLICWEGKAKPCHRHIVSKWFRENGILCEEYEP